MLNQDVLKEFIFDCKMRKLSDRTIKGYRNNNRKMMYFIEQEYQVTELEDTYHQLNGIDHDKLNRDARNGANANTLKNNMLSGKYDKK